MLMSKSRLEKFLYALYSLDSSDLPTPLSRIEELYKCLVTGEEPPTFEPLSRVEKYLMAILGVYDVDSIPNPLSRVEVLLHKLATGDDNLDDVKSFLSEHEELLAEIIRNGINIEYVLYTLSTEFNTLYNTAEKPVKSAILSGQTLVNLVKNPSDKKIVGKSNGTNARYEYLYQLDTTKTYTLQFVVSDFNGSTSFSCSINNGNQHIYDFKINGNGTYKVLTQSASGPSTELWFYWSSDAWSDENTAKVSNIVFIEGDYTNVDIPYFEGMQSVKMPVLTTTGKNLFDYQNKEESCYYFYDTGAKVLNLSVDTYCVEVKPSCKYVLSCETNKSISHITFWDSNLNYISGVGRSDQYTIYFTSPSSCKYVKFPVHKSIIVTNIQLEESENKTSYEPFKSNILTVNEEVELRGIGDVKDELNLTTGEYVQRIGEVYIDGTQEYSDHKSDDIFYCIRIPVDKKPIVTKDNKIKVVSDKIKTVDYDDYYNLRDSGIALYEGTNTEVETLYLSFKKSELDTSSTFLQGAKKWLSENPITVQYQLATESVKTVDLSVVNQDENNTKLSTFNDITHVTLSSEGLIPEAELEVATKNEEVLNTMSLEMDDISKTQNDLQETSDTQSESVDLTMIATTEIYEGLL